MVSSLVAQSLFRVRLGEGQAVLVEAIPIGHRIRDLVELSNGPIALKTDDDLLVFLEPIDADPSDRARVQRLAARSSQPDVPDAIRLHRTEPMESVRRFGA